MGTVPLGGGLLTRNTSQHGNIYASEWLFDRVQRVWDKITAEVHIPKDFVLPLQTPTRTHGAQASVYKSSR